eukprot:TRINITY_DN106618_c0_g1_i1.p1 TRINITY_DN106618_c0_g1~~TRINITY_DN106618_c0_g1_i1.p1  ORF type:complete len:291 (-),score=42.95 TRINITY_DN106618_c0_g1_i1:35-907(-)
MAVLTPGPRERRQPFLDLTPSPTGRRGRPDQLLGSPDATCVQRFSLRSRSHPYAQDVRSLLQPGRVNLKPPPDLVERFETVIKLCRCSWTKRLESNHKRICERPTDDHEEFWLLDSMSRAFYGEQAELEGGEALLTQEQMQVAVKATMSLLDVSFIIEPGHDTVLGYAALRKAGVAAIPVPLSSPVSAVSRSGTSTPATEGSIPVRPPTPGVPMVLSQLYVTSQFRRRGIATAALRVLLAEKNSVAVEPAQAHQVRSLVRRLGFIEEREEFINDEDLTVFYRHRTPDENL